MTRTMTRTTTRRREQQTRQLQQQKHTNPPFFRGGWAGVLWREGRREGGRMSESPLSVVSVVLPGGQQPEEGKRINDTPF